MWNKTLWSSVNVQVDPLGQLVQSLLVQGLRSLLRHHDSNTSISSALSLHTLQLSYHAHDYSLLLAAMKTDCWQSTVSSTNVLLWFVIAFSSGQISFNF